MNIGNDDNLKEMWEELVGNGKKAVYNFVSSPHPDIEKYLNPEIMINDFTVYDEEYEVTGSYYEDVCSMCRNATAWAILQLQNKHSEILNDLEIVDGNFGWMEHTWLVYKGKYYIDLTLAQFKQDAPKLAILEVSDDIRTEKRMDVLSDNHKYREWGRTPIVEWILTQ
jgi:hypothetical protein